MKYVSRLRFIGARMAVTINRTSLTDVSCPTGATDNSTTEDPGNSGSGR